MNKITYRIDSKVKGGSDLSWSHYDDGPLEIMNIQFDAAVLYYQHWDFRLVRIVTTESVINRVIR